MVPMWSVEANSCGVAGNAFPLPLAVAVLIIDGARDDGRVALLAGLGDRARGLRRVETDGTGD